MIHRRLVLIVSLLAAAVAGCGKKIQPARPEMTQRQRDSAIGESRIPGAAGVRGALRAQDSAQARTNRLDSIPQ